LFRVNGLPRHHKVFRADFRALKVHRGFKAPRAAAVKALKVRPEVRAHKVLKAHKGFRDRRASKDFRVQERKVRKGRREVAVEEAVLAQERFTD
jgi:hypothetical protein